MWAGIEDDDNNASATRKQNPKAGSRIAGDYNAMAQLFEASLAKRARKWSKC